VAGYGKLLAQGTALPVCNGDSPFKVDCYGFPVRRIDNVGIENLVGVFVTVRCEIIAGKYRKNKDK